MLMLPIVAFGQTVQPYDPNQDIAASEGVGKVTGLSGTYGLVTTLVGYLVALFWILTVVFFILAAIQYLTAQGDPEKAKKAKKMVTYGIIAVVVALFSTAIRALVLNALAGV